MQTISLLYEHKQPPEGGCLIFVHCFTTKLMVEGQSLVPLKIVASASVRQNTVVAKQPGNIKSISFTFDMSNEERLTIKCQPLK